MTTLMDELQDYLRIDGGEENSSLFLLLNSAISYLENAGVKKPIDEFAKVDGVDVYAQYRLAVLMLTTHWYENRLVITPAMARNAQLAIPYGLESMILQLRYSGSEDS